MNNDKLQNIFLYISYILYLFMFKFYFPKNTIVDFIRENCNQSSKYSEEEIFRAIGILSTNGVNQGMMLGHGLYPTFSFISHRFVSERIELYIYIYIYIQILM